MAGQWEEGNVTIFPFLPGGYTYTEVFGLNDLKQMAGMNYYYGTDWIFRATLWDNDTTIDLGVLPGFINSRATGINSNGVIVGSSSMGNVGNITVDSSMSFQIINNNMQIINIPNGYRGSTVWDINDNNSIAGVAVYSETPNSEKLLHAAVWINGAMSDINGQTFRQSLSLSINNSNKVCGYGLYEVPPPLSNQMEAFVWSGGLTRLGFLPGYIHSFANAVNDDGTVVGECWPEAGSQKTGFIWKNNTMIDLNTLISPDSGVTITKAVDINNRGQILVRGIGPNPYIDTYILKPIELTITKPDLGDLFIAGQKDTIKWENGNLNQDIAFKYSLDEGSTYTEIPQVANTDSGYFIWDVPNDLLSTKAMLMAIDYNTGEELAESELFRIKPYIITRLDANGDYVAYDINTDRWGFGNTTQDMWPVWWWLRFNYIAGRDPFTGLSYPQHFCDSIFAKTPFSDRPDWISFVNTFGVDACYIYPQAGIYRTPALQYWKAIKGSWGGSCFGIALSNALAFEKRSDFTNRYTNFPNFNDPITVQSDTNVIPVIMELFTHQLGNPHQYYRNTTGMHKYPAQTIRDLKTMLREDSVEVRTLSMISNSTDPQNQGGHAILAYKLEQDDTNPELYYVYVYDNSYPNLLDAKINVDTSDNGGIGLWDPEYGWDGWEGNKWFYLRDPANSYLTNAVLPKVNEYKSPFVLNESELNIYNTQDAYIIIEDNFGNKTGYTNNGLTLNVPNSVPLIVEDGNLGPPYGYNLQTDNYSVVMNNFSADTISAFFFTGNRSFEYERYGVYQNQTDRLFFDGGVSATNPDNELKEIKLLNIVSDTTQISDKLIVIRSLDLRLNDSVKIENIENDDIKLISYGSSKTYGIGLEFTSENNYQIFGSSNVELPENTTHIFNPDWPDVSSSELMVYVDIGNNGSIDDTLFLINQITSFDEDQGSFVPTKFRLGQNYPNPFNANTLIQYSIPQTSNVVLKVYDILGNEIAALVNEEKQQGVYTVTFDASNLTSGIYFYRIQAGSFVDTKKMILLK